MSKGIDYGLGKTNIDLQTGIRFGVISQYDISQAWSDSAKPQYGGPHCPKCGNDVVSYEDAKHEDYPHYTEGYRSCADYACESCKVYFEAQDAFPNEPLGYTYEDGGYVMQDCLDSDVMILRSPYYTFAQFCSPCVPGAGNLNNYLADGVKTYALGHDWFESGGAPYPLFDVKTSEQVLPPDTNTRTA